MARTIQKRVVWRGVKVMDFVSWLALIGMVCGFLYGIFITSVPPQSPPPNHTKTDVGLTLLYATVGLVGGTVGGFVGGVILNLSLRVTGGIRLIVEDTLCHEDTTPDPARSPNPPAAGPQPDDGNDRPNGAPTPPEWPRW